MKKIKKIGLIGYGKMGSLIKKLVESHGFVIESVVDEKGGAITNAAEVYIDFSVANAVLKNVEECSKLKIPVIIGTTGWEKDKDEVRRIVEKSGNTVIYSSNFSLGVNLFSQIIADATKKFGEFSDEYDVVVHEFHHKNKTDSPSGTAVELGNIIIENHPTKLEACSEVLNRKIKPEELHITSTRGGNIPGFHTVLFDSEADTIELTHRARNREGFALGALLAVHKLSEVEPGFYNFRDILFGNSK